MTITAPGPAPAADRGNAAAHAPSAHFEHYLVAALLRLREQLPGIDAPDVALAFPFLRAYDDELPDWLRSAPADDRWRRWCAWIDDWESETRGHLPLRALRDAAGLDHLGLTLLVQAGLVDEDSRFGALFEALHSSDRRRPTIGLLAGWASPPGARREARGALGRLVELGLLQPVDADATVDPSVRPAPLLWGLLRGDGIGRGAGWVSHHPWEDAEPLAALILADAVRQAAAALPELVREGLATAAIVRGPHASGRRTLLAGVARALGYGRLEVDGAGMDGGTWLALGPLATALQAMPIVRIEPGLGETVDVPALRAYGGPVGYTLPLHGGLRGPDPARSVTVAIPVPGPTDRERHWRAALRHGDGPDEPDGTDGSDQPGQLREIASRYRLPAGTIRRAAGLARANARLGGHRGIRLEDVRLATRTLRSRALETLAPMVPASGTWADLVLDEPTREELTRLEERCRSRERLLDVLAPSIGLRSTGVRALFTGPSGTGKTLAARLLASMLEMDLHAVQLSTVVDKYLGETEKHLSALFAHAAELDAMLLLDEGDSLLAKRTDVTTSNDRYANLSTNHALQQLEAHDGIVVITTNAGDRIDPAFLRRIDVVVEFRPPDAAQRWDLWRGHLPPDHAVDDGALADIAYRCQLTGGQIRNAVLHAWLLALERGPDGAVPTTGDVEAAVRREYRKLGTICPLRSDGNR